MRATGLLVAIALLLVASAGAQQPRDNRRPSSTGTASIAGVIVSDDAEGLPLRRTRVMISGSELETSRAVITNDDGFFTFERLPAGRYSLSASKEGYAALAFGATRPGRPGRTVALASGEVRQVGLRLPRGAVITGIIRDPQGEPAAGLPVAVLSRRFSPAIGEQRLMTVPNTNAVTDDRGVYRIFGLAAGAYLVTALPRFPATGATGAAGEITAVSREEVQRALAEVHERRTAQRPGMPRPAPPASASPPRRAGLALAPTYYPGTILESRAAIINLAAAEVRTGVDFDLDYVPTASVEGFVALPPGVRALLTLTPADPAASYQLTGTAGVGADGRFAFRRLQPGHYAIHARAYPSPSPGRTPSAESSYWGTTEVVVSGEDIEGVVLAPEPTVTLAGEVRFDSHDAAAPSLHGFRLPLQIGSRRAASSQFPSAMVEGSSLTLHGVVPGPYRFAAPPHGIRTRVGRWWLKSILIDGQEALDEPLVIAANSKQVTVTFSDRASELSGVVMDEGGSLVTDSYVVIFSENPASWFLHSRRVAAVHTNSEGRYAVRNLPAGKYLVAVSSDLETNEWFDPERLEALRAGATRLTLTNDQSKVQDITVARQP